MSAKASTLGRQEFGFLSEILCRALCRNPAILTGVGPSRWPLLGNRQSTWNVRQTRINIASSYHSDFFCVASSRTGSGFDTVEVCGSSPHGPTIFFNDLASAIFLDQAPIGAINKAVHNHPGDLVIFLLRRMSFVGPLTSNLPGKYQSRRFRIRESSGRLAGSASSVARQPHPARGTLAQSQFARVFTLWPQTDETDAPAS